MSLSRVARCCVGLSCLSLWAIPASAADLSKIDRTLAREPVYQSKPEYCLLVIGGQAQVARSRFWVVLDGETLYVDRNANGDLTEAGESALGRRENGAIRFEIPDLTEPDGKTKHTCLHVLRSEMGFAYIRVRVENGRSWWAGFDDLERLKFGDRPGDAPIVHFNGPRTFGLFRPKTLYRGPQDVVIRLNRLSIGTPGLGKGTFAALDVNQIPEPKRVQAEIEFPSSKEGGEPIKLTDRYRFNA